MSANDLLPYLARHLEEFRRRIDTRGLNILEIGGCLPRDMALETTGARRWIGIDLPDYWAESGDDNPSQHYDMPSFPISQAARAASLDHAVLLGDMIDLPSDIEPFDAVFSSCAFEHISDLAPRLQTVKKVLRPGALLFASAEPIWSASYGDHMLPLQDKDGAVWMPSALQLPDWHQLLWSPQEMTTYLMSKEIPQEVICRAVYWVHHSPHLNRMMFGDYTQLCRTSGFAEYQVVGLPCPKSLNPDTMAVLELLYPGKGPFNYSGVLMLLRA
ncbi:MAG: methyltransferase domain-containing protein [Alphaproteobacteria bacterium]|nr:methyltransferase domain-containing protein [Alphaproteobacteria bacterium]